VSSIVYNVNIFFNEFDEVVVCLQGSLLKDLIKILRIEIYDIALCV